MKKEPPLLSSCLGRRQFSVALAAATMATAAARAQSPARSGNRIVIGQSAALSGPFGVISKPFVAGAKLAFDEVNRAGGLARQRIELMSLDDGYDGKRCIENTRRLVGADVLALFGYTGAPAISAVLPLVKHIQIPLIAPLTGDQKMRNPFNHAIFPVRASYDDEIERMVEQLAYLGLKRIGVFHQNDSEGKAGLVGATKALAARSLTPVAVGTAEVHSDNVASALRVLLPAQPQAIIQVGSYMSCAALVLGARKAGYTGMFCNVSTVGIQALASALEGMTEGITVSQVVPSPWQTFKPSTREFLEAIQQTGSDVQPDYHSLEGYLSARVLIEGLRNTVKQGGKITRGALVKGLEAIETSVAGLPVSYSATDHQGSRFVELSMLTTEGKARV